MPVEQSLADITVNHSASRPKGAWKAVVLVVLGLVLFAGEPGAEDLAVSRLLLYADDDSTTVVSPMVILQKDIYDETSLNFQYIADIQSCASVDVLSSASPSMGYEETRHNIVTGLQHRIDLTTLGLGYAYSTENDYISHAVQAGLAQELFQRNFTLSWNLSYRWDEVGRVQDAFFSEDLKALVSTISIAQTFSPRMIGQLVYFLEYLDGYQGSPYRLVPVADYSVPETHPERRIRHSFTARVKENLSDPLTAEQSLRFYFDSWGLTGETLLLQLYYQLSDPLTLRLRYRFHNQNKADFYEEYYRTPREYMSGDRELGTLQSHLTGTQLRYRFEDLWMFPEILLDIKLEYYFIDYHDYRLLENKEGLLLGAGLELPF